MNYIVELKYGVGVKVGVVCLPQNVGKVWGVYWGVRYGAKRGVKSRMKYGVKHGTKCVINIWGRTWG